MLNTPESNQEPLLLVIIRLLRWHKPEGRLILMIPALWAVFLAAAGKPPLPLVGVIILGTLATSAAGCVVNDLWDRDIDPQVERTRDRPLASRALSVKVGIVVGIIALACAAVLAFYLNSLSFWLSVAAVPVILLYPGAKRVFPVPQLVLSIAWGFAVLISWSAVTQSISTPTWLLWGATVLWTLGFDTVYAMSDREDDQRIGINSSALFFGKYAPTAIGIFFVGTIILLAGVGVLINLNLAFWITLIIATLAWIWQSLRLRNPELPNPVYGEMFRQNVWIGFLILAGMISGSL
ncbi:4-hydroxybenzoate solanesyltransferase [Trichormus variabilis]|uniref:4-hydroxybenzoate solanesyltransferase n=1 Tax=Trichormus variabilis SAG 1403-4b TaxID=447716 RepID=A0A433UX43_ANAVA|nr:4-hydroxybenzoate solanesyltransferase [Trichormus variabilis]MBD2625974.1 4-hydroxybenzoate solanesyltransferase [Trichormus variabilis FACHB-164]RUS98409.1 4-hydroxybenzoate solanesyltransferase [Trichormus variabilis SAG 1403-4b]